MNQFFEVNILFSLVVVSVYDLTVQACETSLLEKLSVPDELSIKGQSQELMPALLYTKSQEQRVVAPWSDQQVVAQSDHGKEPPVQRHQSSLAPLAGQKQHNLREDLLKEQQYGETWQQNISQHGDLEPAQEFRLEPSRSQSYQDLSQQGEADERRQLLFRASTQLVPAGKAVDLEGTDQLERRYLKPEKTVLGSSIKELTSVTR